MKLEATVQKLTNRFVELTLTANSFSDQRFLKALYQVFDRGKPAEVLISREDEDEDDVFSIGVNAE